MSHPKFHEHNLIDAVHTFLENGYPLHFIFVTINSKLLFYIHKYKKTYISYFPTDKFLKEKIPTDKFFIISYVKTVSENFSPIVLKMNSMLAYTIPNVKQIYEKRQRRLIKLRGGLQNIL